MPNAPIAHACSRGDHVFLWFIGTSVLAMWNVFHDSRFDNRLLIVGVLLPDVVDAVWGGARGLHSVTGSVAVLALIMIATYGRRPIRRRLLAIPIGMFLHLIFDGAFNNTEVFWWPFTGVRFAGDRLPVVDRGLSNVVFEIVGAALCAYSWKLFGLGDASRRREFFASGSLSKVNP